MKVENAKNREFKMLLEPHLHSLKSYAFRITGNEEDAQDLLQDTLFKAFRALDQFQKNTNFKAWLYRIMVNTYISLYRKKKKQPAQISYDDLESYQLPIHEDNTDAKLDLFPDEIQMALDALPYAYRVVVVLSDIKELSYHEIAQLLAIPIGTVMSRLHRGRANLKTRLKKYAIEQNALQSIVTAY
jgi:RNA polymerase sigma-70 factor (ECF subfamily)